MHITNSPLEPSAEEIDFDQFMAVDIRLGKVVKVEEFPKARNPSYKLEIDFGEGVGFKKSSAQITKYSQEELVGRNIMAVVNFPPRNIAGFMSEVLVLGFALEDGSIELPVLSSLIQKGARLL